jgi:hypothetical protein
LSRDLPWPPLLIDRVTEASLGASVAFVMILLGRWLLTARVLARCAANPTLRERTVDR